MDDRLDLYHGGTYSTLELSYIPVPIQLITQGNSSSGCFFVWNIWLQSSTLHLERRCPPLCQRLPGSISWTCHQGPCIAGSPSKRRVHWRLDLHGPSVRGHFTSILSPRMYKTMGRWKSSAEFFHIHLYVLLNCPGTGTFSICYVWEKPLHCHWLVRWTRRTVEFHSKRKGAGSTNNRTSDFIIFWWILLSLLLLYYTIYYLVQLFFEIFHSIFSVLARVSSRLKSCGEEFFVIFPWPQDVVP